MATERRQKEVEGNTTATGGHLKSSTPINHFPCRSSDHDYCVSTPEFNLGKSYISKLGET